MAEIRMLVHVVRDIPRLESNGGIFRLSEDWVTDCNGVLKSPFVVECGFETDGASIPRWLRPVCGSPMERPRLYAAIVHDRMYTSPSKVDIDGTGLVECTRKIADAVYRAHMISLGVSRVKAYTEYCAIRLFGGSHWRRD